MSNGDGDESAGKDGETAGVSHDEDGRRRRDWSGRLLLVGAAAAVLWAAVAAYGAGWGLWPREGAITQLYLVAALAAFVFVIGVALLLRRRSGEKKSRGMMLPLVAVFVAFALCIYLGSWAWKAATSPELHDISTDLADPPRYQAIALRDDNYDSVPGANDDDMRGLSPRERWEQLHREEYPRIRTVSLDRPVRDIVATALRLAEDRGWDVVAVDPAAGRLEARSRYSPLGYEQDIVLRVRPAERAGVSVIDMRSVSRQANNDLGVNADIVRGFLSDLSGTTSMGAAPD